MTTTNPRYRRLPGVRRNPFRKATIWMADDHVLSVNSRRFSEDYRRYYFKDIQAIILRQTSGTTALSKPMDAVIILGLLAIAIARRQNLWLVIASLVLLAGYLFLKWLGPRCACHLVTAVSRDRIPALCRMRATEKTLRILQPLIEQAQKEPAP